MLRRLGPSLVLLGIFALVAGLQTAAVLVTDAWWFAAQGHSQVFFKALGAQAALGIGLGLVAWLFLTANLSLAMRTVTKNKAQLERAVLAGPLLLGLLAALQGASSWELWLPLSTRGPFGFVEPVFGMDAGFYVFVLPVLQQLHGWLVGLLGLTLIATGAVLGVGGGVRVQLEEIDGQLVARGLSMAPGTRRQLAFLASSAVLLMSIGAYLGRFGLLTDPTGLFVGPTYADLHGTLPLLTGQAIATAVASMMVYLAVERESGFGLVAGAVLIGLSSAATSVYPGVVQRFSVLPNELTREGPQIVDHIAATRAAFALDQVEEAPLSGDAELEWSDIEKNRATIQNVRLWDHKPLLDTFSQVQEIRTYYRFPSVDNDRYRINGELRQIMLSPRELEADALPEQARTWVNQTMTYTHGYGLALGPVNQVTEQGLPELFVQDLPPKVRYPDDLQILRPEIYFGESMPEPVVVNTENPEFDFPAGDANKYTTYSGAGGVTLEGLRRLLVAIRLGSPDLLFSGDLTPESRVLLYRSVLDRVARIAPFLYFDSDPYLVIHEGRLVWIVDAYTASADFPYAQSVSLSGERRVNYLRNAVKVTVDAYDGAVNFYATQPDEPILSAWSEVFPDLFQPLDAMPSGLREHLRVPQDYFDHLSVLFATYHMQDPQIFYNREDQWEVPEVKGREMEPYYTIMTLPGEERPEFILMRPFTPRAKDNLAAWMVARSDGDAYGTLRVYKFPKEKLVFGPGQIDARINQDDEISAKLSLWNQQGSQVEFGTLLVIPVEESLLYVQPLYLRAQHDKPDPRPGLLVQPEAKNTAIPELKRVIVAYENRIAMESTLDQGLRVLFAQKPLRPASAVPPEASEGGTPVSVARAQALYDQAQAALREGDWAGFGEALEALGQTLQQLDASEGGEAGDELGAAPIE